MERTKVKELSSKVLFAAAAIVCIVAVIAIFVFIIIRSVPALSKIGFFNFVFGDVWNPDGDDVYACLLYTSPSPRDRQKSRMPSSA